MRVNTNSVHFRADAKLLAHIEGRLSKLERFFGRLQEAEVFLRLENAGRVRDKVVEVRLRAPGSSIFEKRSAKTFEAAIDSAARSLIERVKELKERSSIHH